MKNRAGAAAVWTGSEMVVWGGFDVAHDAQPALDDGGAYSPASGSWRAIRSGPLVARSSAESAWTGSEMLVWGGQKNFREELSDGAAYNPAADSWRRLSMAPITWHNTSASAWTGSEWWIATEHNGHVDVAVYDPTADSWRPLPGVSEDDFDSLSLASTGSEVLMKTVRGLYRMDAHGSDWTFVAVDFSGPITWADGLLYGSRFDNASPEPLGWDPFYHPVAWDPTTSTERPMAAAPHSAYDYRGGVWTGQYLAFFEDDLAYDPAHDAWIRLHSPRDPNVLGWDYVLENDGTAEVWADDRLLVWGGTNECAFMIGTVATGYELVPTWPATSTGAALAARSTAPGSTGAGGGAVALAC